MANIRWRVKDELALKKKVQSYNAKISRELKKGTSPELLPKKVKYKEVKNKIETRKDYNREFDLLDDFTDRNAMKVEKTNRGGKVPLWLKRQTETKLQVINERRRKQKKIYEEMPLTDRNKKIDEQSQFYKDSNLNQFNDKKVNWENKSAKDIEKFQQSLVEYDVTKEQKDKLYRENYYKSIEESYTPEQANKLKKVLDDIDTDVMVTKYYTDMNMDINFNYDPADRDIKFNELITAWNSVKGSEANIKRKG